MSAIEAVNKLTDRYRQVGKVIHLKHLSEDCRRLLKNAEPLVDINLIEDPAYGVVT